ncbi:Ycf66 family protein [Trichothermofontia sichuanensis B231]|uniref:Ycf66 family protein n=1 Tax=Trichothermofontia sichuanensis TaxID=3045816 RepID=UPI0022486BF9|nr:Ycf66 family protein [Trichothermofontia sichuanensis]UZQ55677.1 Ycf66 family protein [Trichothermofontia sichuanensis B231]
MVNLGLNPASLLGIALAGAGLGLYVLRSIRPELSRDHDIFFAAVGLVSGLILLFQGWRLDPILQFGQFLVAGSAVFFAVESIRLRGVATEQAKRNTPIVDEERPVSRVYRAELDDLVSFDQRSTTRRIRGSRDSRLNERYEDYWDDDYSDDRPIVRSRSTGESDLPRRSGDDWERSEPSRRPRKRPPTRSDDASDTVTSSRRESSIGSRDDREAPPRRRPPVEDIDSAERAKTRTTVTDVPPPRRKRKRPAGESAPANSRRPAPRAEDEIPNADYVAYQPIDPPDMEGRDEAPPADRANTRPDRPQDDYPDAEYDRDRSPADEFDR